jgi:hypothetical protein
MASVVISGDTSGAVTITAPAVAGTPTLTLPTTTGTILTTASTAVVTQAMLSTNVVGNGPAFIVYRGSTAQSIGNATWTKVQYQTEEFDTANYYDNSTNYRFTPLIAGYYQISSSVCFASSSNFLFSIYKNGSEYATGPTVGISGLLDSTGVVSKLVYFNGSTDYVETYCYQNTGGALNLQARIGSSWFTGVLIRSA